MRYRLSSLLALMVCAMTPAGHDSITAAAKWVDDADLTGRSSQDPRYARRARHRP